MKMTINSSPMVNSKFEAGIFEHTIRVENDNSLKVPLGL